MNNSMTLEEAIDFLAKNCPHVFAPIANEMKRIGSTNETLSEKVNLAEKALNDLIFDVKKGGM